MKNGSYFMPREQLLSFMNPGARQRADEFKRDYIDKGWLGVKSGRGFFTYPNPAYLHPDFLGGESGQTTT